jgi:predicted DNA-binding transcriptional regulator AlpA
MDNSDCIKRTDILGTSEVAEVLGVSKQRIASLRKDVNFPEPFLKLASTPLWDRTEVEAFLAKWRPWVLLNRESDDE